MIDILTIQLRRDAASNWTMLNPVLKQGEVGVETDTKKAKLGDGTTAWTSLSYWNPSGAVSSVFGRTGAVVAALGDYSVGQVTGAAPLASPVFTGTPAAPTPSGGDSSTKIATTAYVDKHAGITDWLNVVTQYGADPTGVADSTTAIQNAMNAAGPIGQTVYFPPGNYLISNHLVWNTTAQTTVQLAPSLIGAPGMGGPDTASGRDIGVVQLTASGSFPLGEFMIDYLGPAPAGGDAGNSGFRVSGLVLQCNNRAAGVRSFNSENCEWSYLVLNNVAAPNPVNTSGGPVGALNFVASPSFEANNNRVDRVYIVTAAQHGFYLNEGTGSYIYVLNCEVVNAGWSGFYALNGVTMVGCVAQASGQNNPNSGYYNGEYQIAGVTMIGCVAFNANPKGPSIQVIPEIGIYNTVVGCQFNGTNTAGLPEYFAAVCELIGSANPHRTTFMSCIFLTGTHTSDYVQMDSNAVGTVVFSGCQFIPAGGAPGSHLYNLNGAAAYVKFDSNPGINPVGAQVIAVPLTTIATAALPFDAVFYITAASGGSVAVAISGGPSITIPASAVVPVLVPAGQTLTPTYATGHAPTWVVEGN